MKTSEELEEYQKNLVNFLKNKFCDPYKIDNKKVSRNMYAEKSDIGSSTLTRITDGLGYDVPLSTLFKLCKFEKISLADLFVEFENTNKDIK
ncbi:hypothetical protein D3C87_1357500 [compost metagenome]|uniref:Helix-turn-helix domain-containing protein n=1 Tax=Sphingobacterium anhuiense TaxID=493780 RepID=A0ABW5YU70_9SPHI